MTDFANEGETEGGGLLEYMFDKLQDILPQKELCIISNSKNREEQLFDALLSSYLDLKAMPLVDKDSYNTLLRKTQSITRYEEIVEKLQEKYTEYKDYTEKMLLQLQDRIELKNQCLREKELLICDLQSTIEGQKTQLSEQATANENLQLQLSQQERSLQQSEQQVAKLNDLKKENFDITQNLHSSQEQIAELKAQLQGAKQQVESFSQQQKQNEEAYSVQLQQMEAENSSLKEQIQLNKIQFQQLEQSINNEGESQERFKNELLINQNINKLQDQIEQLKREKNETDDQLLTATTEQARLLYENDMLNEQLVELQQQKQSFDEQLREKQRHADSLTQQLRLSQDELSAIKRDNALSQQLKEENLALKAQNARLQQNEKQLNNELQQLQEYQQKVMMDNKALEQKVDSNELCKNGQMQSLSELQKSLNAIISCYQNQVKIILQSCSCAIQKQIISEYSDYSEDFEDFLGALQLIKFEDVESTVKAVIKLESENTIAKTMILSAVDALGKTKSIDFEEGRIIDVSLK